MPDANAARLARQSVDHLRSELRIARYRHRADEQILTEAIHEAKRRCAALGVRGLGYAAESQFCGDLVARCH